MHCRAHLFLWLVYASLLASSLQHVAVAQSPPASNDSLSLVPPDAIALLTIKPRAIASEEAYRMMPLEVATAAGMQYLGIDPLKIERVEAIMGLPLGGTMNLPAAVLITHGEDIPVQLLQRFSPDGAKSERGLEFWPLPNTPDFVIHLRSPRQAIVGARSYVTRLIKLKQPDGALRTMAKQMGEPGHISLVVVFEQVRELLSGLTESPQLQRMQQLAVHLKTLAEKTQMIAMDVKLGETPVTSYVVQAETEADAAEISKSIASVVRFGGLMLIANVEQEMKQQPGQMPEATIAYVKRLNLFLQEKLALKPTGNRLLLKMEGEELVIGQVGVLTGLLLPAVQAARTSARRMQSANNLKQMGLAIHNFEAALRQIPNDASMFAAPPGRATGGKLSWRVKILPFVEQQQLYDEFHLDEDWDSPHNMKLIDKMPMIYRHPSVVAPPGHTLYQMPSGSKMINEAGKKLRFRDVTDGLSNTIAIVCTNPGAAVVWTKPDELDPVAQRAMMLLENGNNTFAYLDGAVLNVVPPRDDQTWIQGFTVNGGEIAPR